MKKIKGEVQQGLSPFLLELLERIENIENFINGNFHVLSGVGGFMEKVLQLRLNSKHNDS